jgi:hypothetical protein
MQLRMGIDPVTSFLAAMERAGIHAAEPIGDRLGNGEGVRFRTMGDPPGEAHGEAWLWLNGVPDGGFLHRTSGKSGLWALLPPAPASGRPKRARARKRQASSRSEQGKNEGNG